MSSNVLERRSSEKDSNLIANRYKIEKKIGKHSNTLLVQVNLYFINFIELIFILVTLKGFKEQ